MLKKILKNLAAAAFFFSFFSPVSFAQKAKPDTVNAGIYVTSIHDIDFKEQEYTVDFWLWLKYKNPEFDFTKNLEVPLAKSVQKSFATSDTLADGTIYLLMKLQCVMKDSWKINNFPFDQQTLRLSIESAEADAKSLVFKADTLGKHYDPKFTLHEWNIDSFTVMVGRKSYETTFGDPSLKKPHTEYSAFKIRMVVHRNATSLFWKLFIGMYVAFLIAYVSFYIHADSIDSRFSLSVGALFAVIGNKYIVDASLPESLTFTLVDTLHGITLSFILLVVTATAYSLQLVKKGKISHAKKFDMMVAQIILLLYLLLNIYFIEQALH